MKTKLSILGNNTKTAWKACARNFETKGIKPTRHWELRLILSSGNISKKMSGIEHQCKIMTFLKHRIIPCGTARLAVLSSRAESNSAVPWLMVSNGVLLPCLNRNYNFIWVRHGSSTTFGTGTECHDLMPYPGALRTRWGYNGWWDDSQIAFRDFAFLRWVWKSSWETPFTDLSFYTFSCLSKSLYYFKNVNKALSWKLEWAINHASLACLSVYSTLNILPVFYTDK